MDAIRGLIRDIPDFPEPGVIFKDITPLLGDHAGLQLSIGALVNAFRKDRPTHVAGIESRGFILATPVALRLDAGFIPIRKPGKLPYEVISETYQLEYGQDALEMHRDAVEPGDNVLIIDDVLATGGTAAAAARLIEKLGAVVIGIGVLVELEFLEGRKKLPEYDVVSLVRYA